MRNDMREKTCLIFFGELPQRKNVIPYSKVWEKLFELLDKFVEKTIGECGSSCFGS